jgi:hypothetical protein
MEYESSLLRIRDDIYRALGGLVSPSTPATRAGTLAQHNLAAAFERAAGRPHHEAWRAAFESLAAFVELCGHAHTVGGSAALARLQALLVENGDAAPAPAAFAQAS